MDSASPIELPTNAAWDKKFFKPKPDCQDRHIYMSVLYAIPNIVGKRTI